MTVLICTSVRTETLLWLGTPSPQCVPFWIGEGGSGLGGLCLLATSLPVLVGPLRWAEAYGGEGIRQK